MSFKKKQEFVNILVGDSGSSDNSESTMEYVVFNMETDFDTYNIVLGMFSYLVKFPTKIEIRSLINDDDVWIDYAIAFAIDTGAIVDFHGFRKSIKDLALDFGADISLLPHITKEEFYKLPAALIIYGPTAEDAIYYEDQMKTSFDTLWTIWERDGVEGQDLAITIPNTDVASVTLIDNEELHVFNITSILGEINTTTSEIINSIRFNGQYGATLSKRENLTTGEIVYVYESMG